MWKPESVSGAVGHLILDGILLMLATDAVGPMMAFFGSLSGPARIAGWVGRILIAAALVHSGWGLIGWLCEIDRLRKGR